MASTSTTFAGSLAAATLSGNGAAITSLAPSAFTLTNNIDDVAIYSSTGALSAEPHLAPSRGGTGVDTSGSSGLPVVSAGTWTVSTTPSLAIATNARRTSYTNQVTTADATPTTIATIPLTPDASQPKSAVTIRAYVVCGKTGDGTTAINSEYWNLLIGANYNSTGPAITDVVITNQESGSLGTYSVTVANASPNLLIQVNGAASTTVNWACFADVIMQSFAN